MATTLASAPPLLCWSPPRLPQLTELVTEEELQQTRQELFERLGEPEIKTTPKGNIEVWRLSDDPPSTVTYRPFSKSGGPTIDMNDVDGLDAKRLHIPQH